MNTTIKAIKNITSEEVESVINSIPKSAIFTLEFIKKNGDLRVMNARRGVTKHLVAPELKKREKPAMPSNIVTVFDMQAGAYRHINTATTRRISADHVVYVVR